MGIAATFMCGDKLWLTVEIVQKKLQFFPISNDLANTPHFLYKG